MQEVSPVLKGAPSVVVQVPAPKWMCVWGPNATVEAGKIANPYELEEFIPSIDNPDLDRSGLVTPYCYSVEEGGRCLYTKNASCVIELMAAFKGAGPSIPTLTLQLWGFDWTPTARAKAAVEGGEEPGLPFGSPKTRSVATGIAFPLHRDVSASVDSFTISGFNSGTPNDTTRLNFGDRGLVFGDADGTDWLLSARYKFCPVGIWGIFPWITAFTNCDDAVLLARAV